MGDIEVRVEVQEACFQVDIGETAAKIAGLVDGQDSARVILSFPEGRDYAGDWHKLQEFHFGGGGHRPIQLMPVSVVSAVLEGKKYNVTRGYQPGDKKIVLELRRRV